MIKKLFNKIFKKSKREVMSFKQGFDLTEMPIITFYQGDKKFNFLLDTGANDNIIDKSVLDSIEYKEIESKSKVFGAEGILREVSSCEITLTYKSTEYTYKYLINDLKDAFAHIKQDTGVTLHGLIGSKFFNKYKYVLDFEELIAYSKA